MYDNPQRGHAAGSAVEEAPARPLLGGLVRNIAFWQVMMFFMLGCLVWVNEVLDLPNLLLTAPPTAVNWFEASLLTAGIAIVGFITVAHTFVLQRRVLRGIIIVCSYCNKAKVKGTAWQNLEHYLSGKSLAVFSHGVCPTCYRHVRQEMDSELIEHRKRETQSKAPAKSETDLGNAFVGT